MILAGGLGTRLGHLTASIPKPLLPVAGRPFLDYLISEAIRFGFREIVLLAGYRGDAMRRFVEERGSRAGVSITVNVEAEPVGTGGALWQAREYLHEKFLLLNGDSWFDFNWLSLTQTEGAADALATIAVRPVDHPGRFGSVEVEGTLASRFGNGSNTDAGYVNGGVYLMSRRIVDKLRPGCSLERDIFPTLATQGHIRARAFAARFIDIGVLEDLEWAQSNLASWVHRPAVFLDRDGTLNVDSGYVHSTRDFQWLPGAIEAVRRLNDAGVYVFVVTNQAGVAHGFYGETDVVALHHWMQSVLRDHAAHVDDFRFCPYHAEASIEMYRRDDFWRKPKPGMLVDLMQQWSVDVSRSVIIGDKNSDVEAGEAVGIRGIRLDGESLVCAVSRLREETDKDDYRLPRSGPEMPV